MVFLQYDLSVIATLWTTERCCLFQKVDLKAFWW